MNNSIVIKGADFSTNQVAKLNIQKLTIEKGGDSYQIVTDGAVTVAPDTELWSPSKNMAYSEVITFPTGTKYIFGKINLITTTTTFNAYIDTENATVLDSYPAPVWLYHDANDDSWHNLSLLIHARHAKPHVIGYKQELFDSNRFTVALLNGNIYGIPFSSRYSIDKMIINWFRKDGETIPELGIELPEIYAGF